MMFVSSIVQLLIQETNRDNLKTGLFKENSTLVAKINKMVGGKFFIVLSKVRHFFPMA